MAEEREVDGGVALEEIPEVEDTREYSLADIVRELSIPFKPHEIQKRKQAGRDLSYITARQARARLDRVLLPKGWEWYDDQRIVPRDANGKGGGFEKGITLVDPKGKTYGPRWDAGGFPGMPSAEDDFKGGVSDAFKRAAACWGVGAHLYEEGYFGDDEPGAKQGSKVAGPSPQAPPQQRPAQPPHGQNYPEPVDRRPAPPPPPPAPASSAPAPISGGPDLSGPEPGKVLFAWLQDRDKAHGKVDGKPRFAYVNQALKAAGVQKVIVQCDRAQLEAALAACATEIGLGKAEAPSAAKAEGATRIVSEEAAMGILSGPPRYLRSWARKVDAVIGWSATGFIFGPGGWAERDGQSGTVDDWDVSTVSRCYDDTVTALLGDRPEVVGRARLAGSRDRVHQAARDLCNIRMLSCPGDAIPTFAEAHGSGPRTFGEVNDCEDGNLLHEYAETAEGVVTAWEIPDSSVKYGLPSAPVSQSDDNRVQEETPFQRLQREAAGAVQAAKGSKPRNRR